MIFWVLSLSQILLAGTNYRMKLLFSFDQKTAISSLMLVQFKDCITNLKLFNSDSVESEFVVKRSKAKVNYCIGFEGIKVYYGQNIFNQKFVHAIEHTCCAAEIA